MMKRLPSLVVHAGLPAALVLAALSNPAYAFTAEQQQACAPDALKLCSDTIPDIPKTTACMRSHLPELSPACKTAFVAATGGGSERPAAKMASRRPEATPRYASRAQELVQGRSPRESVGTPGAASRPTNRSFPGEPNLAGTGYPPYPAVAGLNPSADGGPADFGSTARLCREGLIDHYTCTVTAPALGLIR